jgi:hypothetical protein
MSSDAEIEHAESVTEQPLYEFTVAASSYVDDLNGWDVTVKVCGFCSASDVLEPRRNNPC